MSDFLAESTFFDFLVFVDFFTDFSDFSADSTFFLVDLALLDFLTDSVFFDFLIDTGLVSLF